MIDSVEFLPRHTEDNKDVCIVTYTTGRQERFVGDNFNISFEPTNSGFASPTAPIRPATLVAELDVTISVGE